MEEDPARQTPEGLHTDAELAELAETMPSIADARATESSSAEWTKEVIDPDETAPEPAVRPGLLARVLTAVRSAVRTSAIRAGGVVIRPSNGQRVRWTPIEPIADEYDAAIALRSSGFSCLGVIGNAAHLRGSGGHTPWCSEGYAGKACRFGKVYAIDLTAPNMGGLETWLVAQLRAGRYGWVYYININGHQYTRVNGFRSRYSSADYHLHISGLAGSENTNSTILRDWQSYRKSGGDDMAQVPQAEWTRLKGQVDAISDILDGGKGAAYKRSQLRGDHGYQIDEIERRLKSYVDTRLTEIETKLDTLIAGLQTPNT